SNSGSFFIHLILMEDTVTTFFNEIRKGNIETIKELVTQFPDLVNSLDQRGSTPLILATYYDFREISNFLLEQGAKIDAKDASGNTALMGTSFKGLVEIAKDLIKRGANVNERNAMGATCLIYTATFNKEELAKLLLESGADKTVKDAKGNTALDHAKMQGFSDMITLLEKIG
ncbi:MAG: ankyrin repeat domain-containing protein, partial [Eudoraea sp.]